MDRDAVLRKAYSDYLDQIKKLKHSANLAEFRWEALPNSIDASGEHGTGRWIYSENLREFSMEISNAINLLMNYTLRLKAWGAVIKSIEGQDERNIVSYEFIEVTSSSALTLPYAIRSRFYHAVCHLSHQANRFVERADWKDDLPGDQNLGHEVAQERAKAWKTWRKLNGKLNRLCSDEFKTQTRDYRNSYHHRFPVHIERGMSGFSTRIVDGDTVYYGFGGSAPLSLSEVTSGLDQEIERIHHSHRAFKELVAEQLPWVFPNVEASR